ncbi:uncharacterized protein [Lepeophtheirus salmonis]|uniref:Uncharacterized protein n=1 Tax=Lepeophtheirus salmonis TaxID=72036 RepID=A0A0K2TLV9_LEPSM|nr:uncharacterized protein LOC121123083 [Lepeophtheirus salmonis]
MSLAGSSLVESAAILLHHLDELVRENLSLQAQNEINKKLNESNEANSGESRRELSPNLEELEDRYHGISHSHKELGLKFSGLQSAVYAAQKSSVMAHLLNIVKTGGQMSPFAEDLDPEEVNYVQELMDEQLELCKEVFATQVEIFTTELKLSKSRSDLVSSFSNLKERHLQMINYEEENESPEVKCHKVSKLKDTLKAEEEKLEQIKFFVLNVLNLHPYLGIDIQSSYESQQEKLIVDCGKSLEKLRQDAYRRSEKRTIS